MKKVLIVGGSGQFSYYLTKFLLKKKYKIYKDKLRWSLKPVFLKYLIENSIADKIIYVDNDIAFFNYYK